jgi:hypothetical protein
VSGEPNVAHVMRLTSRIFELARHPGHRAWCAALLCAALTTLVSPPAQAANALSPSAYLEYSALYGDTYNGVTTDDGDNLAGSYAAKVRVNYGRFTAQYSYHRDLSSSLVNAMTPSGGPGTALNYPAGTVIVPAFTATDAESEIRLEYQPVHLPVYFGLAYSNSFNNYSFPRLTALGIGAELQPNPHKLLSPYASFFYFPDQSGTYPLANPNNPNSGSAHSEFSANELDLGASLAFPKTDLSLVLGYYQTTNVRRTGTFNFVRDGPYVGIGYRVK